jgi:ribonuclease HI
MVLRVYTDGSQIKSNGRPSQTGYAFVIPKWNIQVAGNLQGRNETNNRAELTAIAHAMETIYHKVKEDEICAIDAKETAIYTDSQYALQVMKKWTGPSCVPFRFESKNPRSKWSHLVPVFFIDETRGDLERHSASAMHVYRCDIQSIDAPNSDCIARIYMATYNLLCLGIAVHCCKVEAHTGKTDEISRGNALADELAQRAALTIPTQRQMTPSSTIPATSPKRTSAVETTTAKDAPVIVFGKYKGLPADNSVILKENYLDWVFKEYQKKSKWIVEHPRIVENVRELLSWKTKQHLQMR